jgi:hypothetical protein
VADYVGIDVSFIRNFEIYAYENNARRSLLAITWDVSMDIIIPLASTIEVSANSFSESLLTSLSSDNFTSALILAAPSVSSIQSVKAWPRTRPPTLTPSSNPTQTSTFGPTISFSDSVSAASTPTFVILISVLASGFVLAAFSCYYELHVKPARREKVNSRKKVAPIPSASPPVTLEEGSIGAIAPFTLKGAKTLRPWLDCETHEESSPKHSFWARMEAEEEAMRKQSLTPPEKDPLRPEIESTSYEKSNTAEHSSFFEPASVEDDELEEESRDHDCATPKQQTRSRRSWKVQPILLMEGDKHSVLADNSSTISSRNPVEARNDQRHIKLTPLKLKTSAPALGVDNKATPESDPQTGEVPKISIDTPERKLCVHRLESNVEEARTVPVFIMHSANASPELPEETSHTFEASGGEPKPLVRTTDGILSTADQTTSDTPFEEAQLLVEAWDRELGNLNAELVSLQGRYHTHQRKLRMGTLPSPTAGQQHGDLRRAVLEAWRRKEQRKLAKIAHRMNALHARLTNANENRSAAAHALEEFIAARNTRAACSIALTPRGTAEDMCSRINNNALGSSTIDASYEGGVAAEDEVGNGNEVDEKQPPKALPHKLEPLPSDYTPNPRGL